MKFTTLGMEITYPQGRVFNSRCKCDDLFDG